MVCKNCNRVLPENTSYCIYCGARTGQEPVTAMRGTGAEPNITAPYTVPVGMTENAYLAGRGKAETVPVSPVIPVAPPVKNVEKIPPAPIVPAPPVTPIEVIPAPTPIPQKPPIQTSTSGNGNNLLDLIQKFWWAAVAAALILALVLGMNLSEVKSDLEKVQKDSKAAQAQYEQEIQELKDTIQAQNTTLSQQQDLIASMQEKADAYDSMYEIIATHNMGSATYNFQANTDFMVLRKSNPSAKFTLTAHWREGGEVYLDHSSDCVEVSFDKDSWAQNVQMTVTPKKAGISVVTFSNSIDSNTFSILFLVTE